MTKKQHYMSERERYKLEAYLQAKRPVAWIAREMGFCRQTIYNEMRRGEYLHNCGWRDEWRYSADKAQQIHEYMQTGKGRPIKLGGNFELAQFLENKMLGIMSNGKIDRRRRFSPAAALAEARKAGFTLSVSVGTLYNYIRAGVFLHLTNKDLIEKGREKKQGYKPVHRVAHPNLPGIDERPDYIGKREEPGHFELDLVVSCEKGTGAIMTMTERSGRFEFIRKIPDKKAATVRKALRSILRRMPGGMVIRSITTDNGPEFLEYDELISTVRCPVYYCHSYAAWEKGTNENHNRMVRRWFPKGTDFSKVTAREIRECQNWMNDYPRKSLGWLTPNEYAALIAA